MEMTSQVLLVVILACLAAAVIAAVGQVLKAGLKGLKFMSSGLFFLLYIITYVAWLAL